MTTNEPEWTPNESEREALQHWLAPEPASGMARRVANAYDQRRRRRRTLIGAMVALAACLIAVVAWVVWAPGGSGQPIPVAVGHGDGDGKGALGVKVKGVSLPDGVDVVVANLIASALAEDEAYGWQIYAAQLHSAETYPTALKRWRRFNYKALRRKVKLFVGNKTKPVIQIEDTSVGDRDTLTIKVFNSGNPDMPTPCHFRKDPKAGGAWRVVRCSL